MRRFSFIIVFIATLIGFSIHSKAQSEITSNDSIALNGQQDSFIPASLNGCTLADTQYTLEVEGQDACGTIYVEILLSSSPNVNLYVRRGERVTMENGQIVADYRAESQSQFKSVRLSPPYRGGTYYIAVSNCGAEPASFNLRFAMAVADYFGPFIKEVKLEGKKLMVTGCMFEIDALILINGQEQPTKFTAEGEMPTLIVKKGGKMIKPGETVFIQVKNSIGFPSAPFTFTRTAQ